MDYNQNRVPLSLPTSGVNPTSMMYNPSQEISNPIVYTNPGNPAYILTDQRTLQEDAMRQMAQLSMGTGQPHNIPANQAVYSSHMQPIASSVANGSLPMPPHSMHMLQQPFIPGQSLPAVMQNPLPVTSHPFGNVQYCTQDVRFPHQNSAHQQLQTQMMPPPDQFPIPLNPNQVQISNSVHERVTQQAVRPEQIPLESEQIHNIKSNRASNRTQLNALPHTLPTILNPSLQTRRASASSELSPGSGSDYQYWDPKTSVRRASAADSLSSPRNGASYQVWNPDDSQSDSGSALCSPISPSMGWQEYVLPADKDTCLRCYKKVYVVERVGPIKLAVYHKNCFTCAVCGTKLTMNTFHHNSNEMDDINVYCMSHKPKTKNIGSDANAVYIQSGSKFKMEQQSVRSPPPVNSFPPTQDANGPNPALRVKTVTDNEVTEEKTKPQSDESIQSPPHSAPSTDASPYSSRSSSSSNIAALKPEEQADGNSITDQTDGGPLVRRDRPSSLSSSQSSVPSIETSKPETETEQRPSDDVKDSDKPTSKRPPLLTSLSLERQDRPSNLISPTDNSRNTFNQRSPSSRMIKSQSSHEFPTDNNLGNMVNATGSLPRHEEGRKDRPSQVRWDDK